MELTGFEPVSASLQRRYIYHYTITPNNNYTYIILNKLSNMSILTMKNINSRNFLINNIIKLFKGISILLIHYIIIYYIYTILYYKYRVY